MIVRRHSVRGLLWLALSILGALPTAPSTWAGDDETVELLCPCRVTAVDQTAVGVEFGVRSINPDTESGLLRLVLLASEQPEAIRGFYAAEYHLEPLPAQDEHAHEVRVSGLDSYDSGKPRYLRLILWEDETIVDSIRLDGALRLTREGGSTHNSDEYGYGGIHFRGETAVTLTGDSVSVSLPRIVNTSTTVAKQLTLRVRATQGPIGYSRGYALLIQDLDVEIEPGAAVEGLTVEGKSLSVLPAGYDYLHVVLTNTPEGGTTDTAWQPPLVWQTAPSKEGAQWSARQFSLGNFDVLLDSDGDGVSDFNERRFAYADPDDPSVKPPASTIRLLMLTTPVAENFFDDEIGAKIDHDIAYTERIFAESGVDVRFELAGIDHVDPIHLETFDIASAMRDREPPFDDLDAWLAQFKADIPVIVHKNSADPHGGNASSNGWGFQGDFVTRRGGVAYNLVPNSDTLAHEIGHVMGLHHSRRQREYGTFKWSVGHGEDNRFVTVMAYNSAFGGAPGIDLFSSPDLMCKDRACGIDRTDPYAGADAVTSLRATRYQVAAFTGGKPPIITLEEGDHVYTPHRTPFVDPGFRVEDDGDFDLESDVRVTGTVNTDRLGNYTLNYAVADTDGNLTEVARVVTVDVDTDLDGIVDAIDDDDDGDGMPDEFETTYGLDPLVDDAQGDLDSDGYTNLREYRAGTDPTDPESVPGEQAVASVPLFPAASNEDWQGFVRVVNHSDAAGEAMIEAIDDAGGAAPAVTLSLGALETTHFNSGDVEQGNTNKGLSAGTGSGNGDWRLTLTSDLNIEALAYIRTGDGFLTSMHDVVPSSGNRSRVAIFNPGSNRNQVSLLRLINPGSESVDVSVQGIDDKGQPAGDVVRLSVPANAARTVSAADLESGGEGLEGSLGDGSGKWQLAVEADGPMAVMSLLQSPSGHLTNLSTAPARGAAPDSGSTVESRP